MSVLHPQEDVELYYNAYRCLSQMFDTSNLKVRISCGFSLMYISVNLTVAYAANAFNLSSHCFRSLLYQPKRELKNFCYLHGTGYKNPTILRMISFATYYHCTSCNEAHSSATTWWSYHAEQSTHPPWKAVFPAEWWGETPSGELVSPPFVICDLCVGINFQSRYIEVVVSGMLKN